MPCKSLKQPDSELLCLASSSSKCSKRDASGPRGVVASWAPLSTGLSSLSIPAGLLSEVLCGWAVPGRAPRSWEAWALENVSKAGGEIGGNRRWDTSLSDHSPPMGQRSWAFQSCSISIFNAERKVTLGYNV